MPIIGHALARISVSTHNFVTTYVLIRPFVPLPRRLPNSRCSLKICLIIGVHGSLLKLTPPTKRLKQHIVNAFCLPSQAMVKRGCLLCLTFPSDSATLTQLPRTMHMLLSITRFPVWHIMPFGLAGQYTHLVEATSLQPFPPATCLSASHSHVINMNLGVPCFGNLHRARRYLIRGTRC